MSLIIVFLISTIVDSSFGLVALDLEPGFHPIPCMANKKFYYTDWSELTVISNHAAAKVYFNGTLKFVKDLGGKIRINCTTERFQGGEWIPGEFKFVHDDFCSQVSDPFKQPVVYRIVQRGFKQKACPFKAGVRSIQGI